MSESAGDKLPERDLPILTSGQFVEWHQRMADELDTEAMEMQIRLDADPTLRNDPSFIEQKTALRAKVDLLNKVGEDFSNHSVVQSLERFLKRDPEE